MVIVGTAKLQAVERLTQSFTRDTHASRVRGI
jgi:hypothetical protein